MMSLIKRLRKPIGNDLHNCWIQRKEAADRIEKLEIENAKLTNYMHRVQDAVKSFELNKAIAEVNDVTGRSTDPESDPDS